MKGTQWHVKVRGFLGVEVSVFFSANGRTPALSLPNEALRCVWCHPRSSHLHRMSLPTIELSNACIVLTLKICRGTHACKRSRPSMPSQGIYVEHGTDGPCEGWAVPERAVCVAGVTWLAALREGDPSDPTTRQTHAVGRPGVAIEGRLPSWPLVRSGRDLPGDLGART